MSIKSSADFKKKLHSWSPLKPGEDVNNDIVRVRVRLADIESDGDITENDREDSSDLLINDNSSLKGCQLLTLKISLPFHYNPIFECLTLTSR